jgi:hypothetical protein
MRGLLSAVLSFLAWMWYLGPPLLGVGLYLCLRRLEHPTRCKVLDRWAWPRGILRGAIVVWSLYVISILVLSLCVQANLAWAREMMDWFHAYYRIVQGLMQFSVEFAFMTLILIVAHVLVIWLSHQMHRPKLMKFAWRVLAVFVLSWGVFIYTQYPITNPRLGLYTASARFYSSLGLTICWACMVFILVRLLPDCLRWRSLIKAPAIS